MAQLSRLVGAYRLALEAEAGAQKRHEGRNLNTWFDDDGYFVLRGRMSPEDGAIVDAALRRTMSSLETEEVPGDCPFDAYGARQAEALVEMARQTLSPDQVSDRARSAATEVIVHVDLACARREGLGDLLPGGRRRPGTVDRPASVLRRRSGSPHRRQGGKPALGGTQDPLHSAFAAAGPASPGQRLPLSGVRPHPFPRRPPRPPLGPRRRNQARQPGRALSVPPSPGARGRVHHECRPERIRVLRHLRGPGHPHPQAGSRIFMQRPA